MTALQAHVVYCAEQVADDWDAMMERGFGEATLIDAQHLLKMVNAVKRLRRVRRGAAR